MDVSSRRLARVLHRHLAEHGLLSFLSLLGAFRLNVIKRNQARVLHRHLAEHGLLSFLRLLRAFRLHVIKRNQVRRRVTTGTCDEVHVSDEVIKRNQASISNLLRVACFLVAKAQG